MCGRFGFDPRDRGRLESRFPAVDWSGAKLESRFNIAPTQDVVAVPPSLAAADFHWGIQVGGARPSRDLINIRAETVLRPGLFRSFLERGKRVAIPAYPVPGLGRP